jgi:NO-binding membrane sensor protein with MHYT domain
LTHDTRQTIDWLFREEPLLYDMASSDTLLAQYGGDIVPQAFNGGFVALSYLVSWIGAATTLELLNRRTSRSGLSNHILLLGSAVAMGGIAIWCMHFIGNRAIVLGDGEPELQIAYSSGYTALSFFIPILVLLPAFVAIGANSKMYWWRICMGGTIAGAAICGCVLPTKNQNLFLEQR